MPVHYSMCETDVLNLVQRVMGKYHPDLTKAGVTVDCVYAADPDGPALKLHGYACAAVIKKISYKQRVAGRADAEITLDKDHWDDCTEPQKEALVDHELTHLVLVLDQNNRPKLDGADRPRFKMRLHDWELGGFGEVARRHGKAAPEVICARGFKQEFGQLCFDFGKTPAA